MENKFSFKDIPTTKAVHQPFNDLTSYFCIPENSQLIARNMLLLLNAVLF
jgi:hypothetical protein